MNAEGQRVVPWKTVRVFVSSTFNDMHGERDYLVKRVFPELQEWCERRHLRFVDIDLRWGVTEEEAVEGRNTVKICLSAVDECRPFFLCFLGQRRGWIPRRGDLSDETLTMFPGLESALGASLTELEILHAVDHAFRPGYEPAKHAFFYLRHAASLDAIDDRAIRIVYDGADEHDSAIQRWCEARIPAHRARSYLAGWSSAAATPELLLPLECPAATDAGAGEWRERWRAEGITLEPHALQIPPESAIQSRAREVNRRRTAGRFTRFHSGEGRDLASVIRSDLEQAIAAQCPEHIEQTAEDALARELGEQEKFLFLRSRGFIERPGAYGALDGYLARADDGRLFVLTGESGIGKSAMLASWVERRRDAQRWRFHVRFVGASERSTSVDALLRSVVSELAEMHPAALKDAIPRDSHALRLALPDLLEAVGTCVATVIVIDGLDQLETSLGDLAWLPRRLPPNVKLIVSARSSDDEADAEWQRRIDVLAAGGEVIVAHVEPFDTADHRRELVTTRLQEYLKHLDERTIAGLISVPGAGNPLFLDTVAAELRVFGSAVNLPDKIRQAFGDDPASAFEAVLARMESDPVYAIVPPEQAVPLLFGFLTHSRRGLQSGELADLLLRHCGWPEQGHADRRQAALDVVNLHLRQVRPFLVLRQGRHDFFYESFKRAAARRYGGVEWHARLAAYFLEQPCSNRRKLDEQPWQQLRAGQWSALRTTLCDLEFVAAKCAAGMTRDLIADFESAEREAPDAADFHSEEWSEWRQFLALEAHHFERGVGRFPALVHQQALNQPRKGSVSKAAQAWLKRGQLRGPVIERTNRPTWFHPSPARRIHARRVRHLAAAGSRAISATADGTVDCWDVDSGVLLQRIAERRGGIARVELVDGTRVLVAGDDGVLRIFSLESGDVLLTRRDGQRPPVLALDGRRVFFSAITIDGHAAVEWDIRTDETGRTFEHPASIDRIWLTADCLVTASQQTLHTWNRASGHLAATIPFPRDAPLKVAAITPAFAVTIAGDALQVWELETGLCQHLLECGLGRVDEVAAVRGTNTVCASYDRGAVVWELSSGRRISTVHAHDQPIGLLALTPDSRWGVCADGKDKLTVFDLATGEIYRALHAENPVAPVVVAPDGIVIAASAAHDLFVWQLESGVLLRALRGHTAKIEHLVLTGEERLLSASADGTVRLWDLGAARARRSAQTSGTHAELPAMLPDGRAAVNVDGAVEVWNVATATRELRLKDSRRRIEAYDIAGQARLVSRSTDDVLGVWNLETGACEHRLAHSGRILHLSVLSGDWAVSVTADGMLRRWNLTAGSCETAFAIFGSEVRRLIALSEDRVVAIGPADAIGREVIAIWDCRSGQRLQVFDEAYVLAIAVGECDRLVVATWSPVLHVYDIRTGTLERVLAPDVEEYDSISGLEIDRSGRVIARCGDDSMRAWDLATGTYLGPFDPTSDAGQVPSAIAFEAGIVWRTPAADAHYPLHGSPRAAFDLVRGLAVLVEAGSGELHLLRIDESAAATASPPQPEERPGVLRIAPMFSTTALEREEAQQRIKNGQRQRHAAKVLAAAAGALAVAGLAAGFLDAWLWWIGVPLTIAAGIFILGLAAAVEEEPEPSTPADFVLQASRLRVQGDLAGAVAKLDRAAELCRAAKADDALVTVLIEKASVLDELGQLDDALSVLREAEPYAKTGEDRNYQLCVVGQLMILEERYHDGDDPGPMLTLLERLEAHARAANRIEDAFVFVAERAHLLNRGGRFDEAIGAAIGAVMSTPDRDPKYLLQAIGVKNHEEMLAAFRAFGHDSSALSSVRRAHVKVRPEQEMALLQEQALIFEQVGDYDHALEAFVEMERLAEAQNDRVVLSMSLNNQAYMHAQNGRIAEAAPLFERAVDLARERGDQKHLGWFLRTHALALLENHGDLDAALAYAEEAEKIEAERGDDDEILHSIELQTKVHFRRGDHARDLETLEKFITRLRRLSREAELVPALRRKTAAIRSLDTDLAAAIPVFDEMIEICRRIDDPYHLAVAMSERSIVTGSMPGRREEAVEQLLEACHILRRLGKTKEVRQVDGILRSLQQTEPKESAAAEAVEPARRALEIAAEAAEQRAEAALDAGRAEEALAFADQALTLARGLGDADRLVHALAAKALVFDALGRPNDARLLVDEVEPLARAHGLDHVLSELAGIGHT